MFLSGIANVGVAAVVFLGLAGPAGAAETYTENFETGFTLGVPVGNHADWYGGPTVNTGLGVAGSVGWNFSGTPATWTGVTFDWSGAQFNSYTVGMDFRTDGSARFDDDRVGFSIYNPTTDSSNVMSVQMDPGGSGYNIEGYWDGVGGADKRPSIVNLTGLSANSWYRLTAVYTKTAIANEPIISVDLQGLDGSSNPTGSVASGTLDTSTLAAGDRPHTKYFSGSVSPAYKNYNHGLADNALAIIDDDTPPPPPPPPPGPENHFTVTADMRGYHSSFTNLCQAINSDVDGPGMFHVSIGDIDPIPPNRAVIDAQFGEAAIWYPIIGNHEEETGADMEWLRAEYDSGHGVRTPLSDSSLTNADGPVGTQRVCYTWDNPATNTHFIALNEYWNGGPNEGTGSSTSGDDTARDGDVVQQLRTWLAADLAANSDKAIFVFGHEPAFPENRHVGDSLDAYDGNRDAFWALLEQYDAVAYMCGHTHYYSKHEGDKDGIGDVWQIDVGNAGNDPGDGMTFVDVVILDGEVRFDVYKSPGGWQLVDTWTVTANCHEVFLGDANLDGLVDGQDFTFLKAFYGEGTLQDPATWDMGNFNDDHLVDGQDFTILKAYYGEGTTSPADAIPEPAALALLLIGGAAVLRRRRRQQRG